MSTSELADVSRMQRNADERLLEYRKYATQFDHQNKYNPAYHELQEILVDWLPKFGLGDHPDICDLGAGTGNFTLRMAEVVPNARYTHLDKDENMNALANEKYVQAGVKNIKIVDSFIQQADFQPASFDLIVCINALNTAPPQEDVLKLMTSWLRPGGWVFVVDFGREQRVLDWALYCAYHAAKSDGVSSMLRYAAGCTEAFKQNYRARQDQNHGTMWLHETEQFKNMFVDAGLEVVEYSKVYREYADLVIAQKDPLVVSEPVSN